ncbi:hypothetical protein EET67_23310 [Pseudaminobacter arsenicus]|uniref:Uncharacterized protein n=1 Tax=Borborobacter arsenicus TaxID=1851146 RepID=A0A432UZP9_9HYPH|nr:hypothetical protein [Pseudaminobacter arsenicus]RUM95416.1 hypothetical protein EET67_23310 [Pseudaminobacter arsenicus]
MGYRYPRNNGVLEPVDLALIERVLLHLSAERRFAAESSEFDTLAIRALALFCSGVTDEGSLSAALRAVPCR